MFSFSRWAPITRVDPLVDTEANQRVGDGLLKCSKGGNSVCVFACLARSISNQTNQFSTMLEQV